MKTHIIKTLAIVTLFVAFSACKKDEASTPNNTNTVNKTPDLVADKWITQKVFIDGAEQTNSFLLGSIYQFWENGSYSFLIPGVASAGGTWAFNNTEHTALKLSNSQSAGQTWNIVTLSKTAFVVEFTSNNKVTKYEFSHP